MMSGGPWPAARADGAERGTKNMTVAASQLAWAVCEQRAPIPRQRSSPAIALAQPPLLGYGGGEWVRGGFGCAQPLRGNDGRTYGGLAGM